jgi:putative redox protein
MAENMNITAQLDTGWRFIIGPETAHPVALDGEHLTAFSPMEMLLGSLASCSGVSVYSILQKKREQVTRYEVRVSGTRASEHPKVFTEITLEHIISGYHINPASVERAIELAETRYCGVSIMLSKAVQLTNTYQIIEEQ